MKAYKINKILEVAHFLSFILIISVKERKFATFRIIIGSSLIINIHVDNLPTTYSTCI